MFALLLWFPITLCSQFLTDGGQRQITRTVIPAARLHIHQARAEREGREGTAVQNTPTLLSWGKIKAPRTLGVSVRVRPLTAPQRDTQSSGVLRKLLGSNGCQKVKMTGVWSVHWKSICMFVSWRPIQSCPTSDRKSIGMKKQPRPTDTNHLRSYWGGGVISILGMCFIYVCAHRR